MRYRKILSLLLLILAVFCVAAMVYLGRTAFFNKTEQADFASVQMKQNENMQGAQTDGVSTEMVDGASTETDIASAETDIAPVETPVPTPTAEPVATPIPARLPLDQAVVPPETDVLSTNSIFLDLNANTVIVAKDADVRISPASMTKILTILVAAEHITDLDAPFTVTGDMTGYSFTNGCSAAGFVNGETVPVRDLFYGTILPSGGEAAVALAVCAAGSHEAFVDMMNEKLGQLGLADTAHFTNCVGIYDENHYCTTYDMAMIMKAAIANDFCREVLSTHVYTTTATEQNPEGIVLSNWFLRRIEDKDGGTVVAAKTGFVQQSGDCAASYGISASGNPYICVTVNTYSTWRCIYDHVAMYQLYGK